MARRWKEAFSASEYDRYQDLMVRDNLDSVRVGLLLAIVVTGIKLLLDLLVLHRNPTSLLDALLLLVFAVSRLYLGTHGESLRHPLLVSYLLFSLLVLGDALSGTLLAGHVRAFSFYMALLFPVAFIIDKPRRKMAVTLSSVAVFLLLDVFSDRPWSLVLDDALHALITLCIAFALTYLLSLQQVRGTRRLVEQRRRAETDSITGLFNMRALHNRAPRFLHKPVTVLCITFGNMHALVDAAGLKQVFPLMTRYTQIFTSVFGYDHLFRRHDGAILVFLEGEADVEPLVAECRSQAKDSGPVDLSILTLSYGYATGRAENEEELWAIARMAYLYSRRPNPDSLSSFKVSGGAYRKETLDVLQEEAIIGSQDTPDSLTGLMRLSTFLDQARTVLAVRSNGERPIILVRYDVESFSRYNLRYGYVQGDLLIKRIAGSLRKAFPGRLVCRHVPDHFLVLCYEDELEEGMRTFRGMMARDERKGVRILASAVLHKPGVPVSRLCDQTKLAGETLKNTGDDFAWFSEAMVKDQERAQYVCSHVDEAIEKGWIVPFFQPIVETESGKVVAMEALARWQDPVEGLLSPSVFITPLEQIGKLERLDLAILRQSVAFLKNAQVPVVSVNFSRHDFSRLDLPDEVDRIVREAGIEPRRIAIELTEAVLVKQPGPILSAIERFHDLGYQVWMDDFGSGYSNLSMMQITRFDLIKLDMAFLRNLDGDPSRVELLKSVVSLVGRQHVACLCEGVETLQQWNLLKDTPCSYVQGYYFGKPVPATKNHTEA